MNGKFYKTLKNCSEFEKPSTMESFGKKMPQKKCCDMFHFIHGTFLISNQNLLLNG